MRLLTLTLAVLLVSRTAANSIIQRKSFSSKRNDPLQGEYTPTALELLRGGSSSNDGSIDWRYFLAGGICASFSHGITTPIDVIKTRMQTFPEKYKHGMIQAAKDIIAVEGLSFLLAGLAPTVVGYGLEGALKFGIYETFKGVFKTLTAIPFINFLLASVVAGAIASIVLCPMEEARIKMVGEASWAKENLISALSRLVAENGVLSTFGGLAAMLSKQVPYTIGKQVSFDIISKYLYALSVQLPATVSKDMIKWGISILSAFFAAICACLCSQPGDMILTATYKGHGGHSHGPAVETSSKSEEMSDDDKSFFLTVNKIYNKYGLTGFFMGLQARLAHVASIITSQLVLYDIVKAALGLPVTGSH